MNVMYRMSSYDRVHFLEQLHVTLFALQLLLSKAQTRKKTLAVSYVSDSTNNSEISYRLDCFLDISTAVPQNIFQKRCAVLLFEKNSRF